MQNLNWIKVENPYKVFKLTVVVFFPFTFLMCLGLFLSWDSIYFEGTELKAQSGWILLFYVFALPGSLGTLFILLLYIETIVFVAVDEKRIALKFAPGNIKIFYWDQIDKIYIGDKKNPSISLNIKKHSGYSFNMSDAEGILHYYEKATGKEALKR